MKLLVIGLDGASFDLLNYFKSKGCLPTFSKLMDEGLFYPLRSTTPPHTAPGWVSSLTGVNPGNHGTYQFWDTQSPSYIGRFMGSNDVGVPFIWKTLNESGYSTGLINIPMTHPPKEVSGYILTWPLSNTLRYCYPADLIKEIAAHQGHYASDLVTMFHGDVNYINEAVEITRKRFQTIKYLVQEKPVDFFMTVFTEIDRVSHFYWRYMASNDSNPGLRDAIKNIYIETDRMLGEILNLFEEDTTLMIYSDHGFEQGNIDFYVQTYLKTVGALHLKQEPDDYMLEDNWFEYVYDNKKYTVDWDKTIAYMAAPGSYGININLKGRQDKGIIEPSEYEEVCQKVIEQLKLVINPLDNKPLFKEVVKSSSVYHGKLTCSAPDIIMIPEKWGTMVHHKITDSDLFNFEPEQKGMHSTNGIFLMYGNKIKDLGHTPPQNLYDIAPTILDIFDVPIPLYMEGASIFSLQDKRDTTIPFELANGQSSYSDKEQSEIKERLKSLGYY
jgi:predicted AlkP superfamily phosphohydrolase/phosphomutase